MARAFREYVESIEKAANWLEAQLTGEGAIAPAGGMGAMYKTGAALAAAGRLNAAWRLMDDTVRRFQRAPGEFRQDNETELDRSESFYRTCWILMGALRMGRFDVASPAALEHVYAFQDDATGGFFSTLEESAQTQISAVHTTMAGWLCLYTARPERARHAGDRRERVDRAGGHLRNALLGDVVRGDGEVVPRAGGPVGGARPLPVISRRDLNAGAQQRVGAGVEDVVGAAVELHARDRFPRVGVEDGVRRQGQGAALVDGIGAVGQEPNGRIGEHDPALQRLQFQGDSTALPTRLACSLAGALHLVSPREIATVCMSIRSAETSLTPPYNGNAHTRVPGRAVGSSRVRR